MPDTQQIAATNRARYALLMDRRRVLFELHKLHETILRHERYDDAIAAHAGLAGLVGDEFAQTTGDLCGRACQASLPALERDITRLYVSLSALAKVWLGLENRADLEPLVVAYYDALY